MSVELKQKIGQLFMVGFDALEANDNIKRLIREQRIGGVILFRRNVHTPQQLSALARQLQEINAEVSDLPLLIAIDQEGGMVMRIEQGVTPIPARWHSRKPVRSRIAKRCLSSTATNCARSAST